jgi:hypothetical protein
MGFFTHHRTQRVPFQAIPSLKDGLIGILTGACNLFDRDLAHASVFDIVQYCQCFFIIQWGQVLTETIGEVGLL